MRRANEVMERMEREDPQAWQDYLSELRGFEGGTVRDGLSDAAAEWPEYNEGCWRGARCRIRPVTSCLPTSIR